MKRAVLIAGLALVGAHAVFVELGARWDFASALLSPGSHSALGALLLGIALLATRLAVLVLLPALGLGALSFQALGWIRGRNRPS